MNTTTKNIQQIIQNLKTQFCCLSWAMFKEAICPLKSTLLYFSDQNKTLIKQIVFFFKENQFKSYIISNKIVYTYIYIDMHVPKNFKQRKSLNQTFCVSLPRVIGIVSVCILSSLQPCNCQPYIESLLRKKYFPFLFINTKDCQFFKKKLYTKLSLCPDLSLNFSFLTPPLSNYST